MEISKIIINDIELSENTDYIIRLKNADKEIVLTEKAIIRITDNKPLSEYIKIDLCGYNGPVVIQCKNR